MRRESNELAWTPVFRDRPASLVLAAEAEYHLPIQGRSRIEFGRVPEEGSRGSQEHTGTGREGSEFRAAVGEEEQPCIEKADCVYGRLSGLAHNHDGRRHHRQAGLRTELYGLPQGSPKGRDIRTRLGLSG